MLETLRLSSLQLLFSYEELGGEFRDCVTTMEDIQEALEMQLEKYLVDVFNQSGVDLWGSWLGEFFGMGAVDYSQIPGLLLYEWYVDYEEGDVYAYINCPFCTVAWRAANETYSETTLEAIQREFPNELRGQKEEVKEDKFYGAGKLERNKKCFFEELSLPLSRN